MPVSIIIAVLASGAALAAAWLLFGALVLPTPTEASQSVVTVLSVTGPCASLEQTVRGLVWLSRSGLLGMDIVISDEGMDEETRLAAATIERRYREVRLRAGNT